MQLSVTSITDGDLEEAAALFRVVFAAPPWHASHTLDDARQFLHAQLGEPQSLGILVREDPTGRAMALGIGQFVATEHGVAFQLREMGVEPAQQRRGIGTAVLRLLEERARKRGATSVTLSTSAAILPFYEKAGYTRTDDGSRSSWIPMVRKLATGESLTRAPTTAEPSPPSGRAEPG